MAGGAAGSPPFVGRELEIDLLDEALVRARAGHGGLVLVAGEPGIGKTRLADEVGGRARALGVRVFWGRAWEGGGAPPFWPWVQVVRGLVAEVGTDALVPALGDRSRELVRLLPELGECLPPAPRLPEVEAERARFLLFDATAALLRAAAEATPTLLVLDDLHAADSASLLLLLFVARTAPASPLLVLALLREAEMRGSPATADLLAQLAREGRTLALRGLDETEVGALARGRAGRALAPETVRAIHEATGGNPLFVDEVVRMLLVEARPADGERLPPLPLPEGVRDAIRRRCAPLTAEARAVLGLAAVFGREFELPALAALAAAPAERLIELLSDAIAAGLVAPVAGHPGRYRFAHVLVREALYEDLRPAERLRRHREAGEALERLHAGRLEPHLAAIAHHFMEAAGAGDVVRAADYARRAAEHALVQLAPEAAARHCELALRALAAHGSSEAERVPILLVLGEAYRRMADPARARATFAEAAAGARRLGDATLLARAALGLGHSATESGAVDRRLLGLLEDALAALGPADDPLRAHLLGRLGEAMYFTKERARGAVLAGEAVEMARRLGRQDVLATALIRRHFTIWEPDTADERLALSAEAARVAASLGLREVELVATSWYVADLLEHGEARVADGEIAAYGELAESLRVPEFRWRARFLRATRALMRGEFEPAQALAREASAIDDGVHAFQFFAVQQVALALEGGKAGALEDVVETMRGLAERYPMVPVWRLAFARVCAELGRLEEARRELDALAADGFGEIPRDGNWLAAMMNASETAVLLGDARHAAVLYRLLRPHARLHVVVGHVAACFGSVERYLGRLAQTLGRAGAAAGHFARAEAADARTGAAPFVAQTRAAWAAVLLERGGSANRARAQALLDGALASARALGIARLVDRLEGLGALRSPRAAGIAGAPPSPRWVFRLEGDYWAVGSGDAVARLHDARGLRYLHLLVGHPQRAFAATELVRHGAPGAEPGPRSALGSAGPVLDERSRTEYARRLAELRAALDEASAHHDLGRIAALEAEIDWLTTTLAGAVGLGGRARQVGSAAERARTAVTKAIRGAIRRIAAESPALGHHLLRSVRTGLLCAYEPDPTHPVCWEL